MTNLATASGTRPTATIQPSSVQSPAFPQQGSFGFAAGQVQNVATSVPMPGVAYSAPSMMPTSNVSFGSPASMLASPGVAAYPGSSPMSSEPKLRAVVPQPGTVPQQQFRPRKKKISLFPFLKKASYMGLSKPNKRV